MGINIKSVQAYLIDLSFPFASEERFLKNKLDKKQIHPVKKFKNARKKRYYFEQQFMAKIQNRCRRITNSALSSIFSQNFKWESTSNLFKPI